MNPYVMPFGTLPHPHPAAFRKDINGLRAWAVLAVMLFHFGVPGFGGGFIGVDVFFVISGFLMAQIIVKGLEGGHFSIWAFYLARARRIVPALLVLCALLLALGWFVLPPPDYYTLGKQVLVSALFVSNIKYWLEAGYFDTASHYKWLLHTWSLSVEWQFYLVLPLLLMLAWRFWPERPVALWLLALGLLGSLALSIWLTTRMHSATFFLLPTRAWEMLAGGLIALVRWRGDRLTFVPWLKRTLSGGGAALIVFSMVTANAGTWPDLCAVLPVLGVTLALLAGVQDSWLTAPAVLQRLGDWSYSIYLWHWPVAVVLAYLGWHEYPVAVVLGLALSLLLGWASYRWIEPLGRKPLTHCRIGRALSAVACAVLLVALPALAISQLGGVPGRLDPKVETIAAGTQDFNPHRAECHVESGNRFKSCVIGGPDIRAIVLGDSHASAVVTAVQAALPTSGQGVMAMSLNGCPTIFDVRQRSSRLYCAAFNEWAFAKMAAVPATVPVIIVNRASLYLWGDRYDASTPLSLPAVHFDDTHTYAQHLTASACRIAATRPVYLLRPLPEMPANVPRAMAFAAELGRPLDMSIPLATYYRRHALVWAAQDQARAECGVHILDPLPYLCANGVCPAMDGTVPNYYDDNHISETGNKRLVPLFESVLQTE